MWCDKPSYDHPSGPCTKNDDGVHRCNRPYDELMEFDARNHLHWCVCGRSWGGRE